LGSTIVSASQDEFLKRTLFTPIKKIKDFVEKEFKSLVFIGVVDKIVETQKVKWWYDGCDYCKTKVDLVFVTVEKDDGSGDIDFKEVYQCKNCTHEEVTATKRYVS